MSAAIMPPLRGLDGARASARACRPVCTLPLVSLSSSQGRTELASKSDVRCVQNRPIKPNALAPLCPPDSPCEHFPLIKPLKTHQQQPRKTATCWIIVLSSCQQGWGRGKEGTSGLSLRLHFWEKPPCSQPEPGSWGRVLSHLPPLPPDPGEKRQRSLDGGLSWVERRALAWGQEGRILSQLPTHLLWGPVGGRSLPISRPQFPHLPHERFILWLF